MRSLFLCFALLVVSQLHAAPRPNIIVMMSDDMGYSDIQPYGGEIKTPVLQRLADNGLRFTQFYNTARCCPTRASLMSGLYPHQAGIGHMMNDRGLDGYRGDLNQNCQTIAEVLKTAGYATFMTGKWHVTPKVTPGSSKHNWPLQRGFDRFYGTIHGAGSFFDPNSLTRDNTLISPYADPEYQPDVYYYTDAISDHAAKFINEHFGANDDKPFFLYVPYTAAHWPMHALPEDIQKYEGVYDEGYAAIREQRFKRMQDMGLVDPQWELSEQEKNWDDVEHREWEVECMKVYAAMVDRMDQGIGKIVSSVEKNGQLDNTLIFFLQDNGGCAEGMGRNAKNAKARADGPTLESIAADELQLDMIPKQTRDGYPVLQGPLIMPGPADTYHGYGRGWANVSNTPFREYKHWVHEGGISTPLIAHWPAGIKRHGELEDTPGHLIDIMATCVDVSGAKYPSEVKGNAIKPMEGKSLAPTFAGKEIEREAIYWEHEGNRAIRQSEWKLVAKENQPWELYNLKQDRTEQHNLASKMPEMVSTLSAKWDAYAERANVLPLGAWRGTQNDKVSNKKHFELSADAVLSKSEAPNAVKTAMTIEAQLDKWGDGVIVAHGGSAYGYALWVADGIVHFCTTNGNQQTIVKSAKKVPSAEVIQVHLKKNGMVNLLADGEQIARGKVKTLQQMPADGLEVGEDAKGLVGTYGESHKFTGVINKVVIDLGK